jgi:hypothetical protein
MGTRLWDVTAKWFESSEQFWNVLLHQCPALA